MLLIVRSGSHATVCCPTHAGSAAERKQTVHEFLAFAFEIAAPGRLVGSGRLSAYAMIVLTDEDLVYLQQEGFNECPQWTKN